MFSPNCFFLVCFVKLATEHRFPHLFQTHHAHKFMDICRLVVDSVNKICCAGSHQRVARISRHVEVNIAYTHMRAHAGQRTVCNADSRRGGETYYTSCLFCWDTSPALAPVVITWRSTMTLQLWCIPFSHQRERCPSVPDLLPSHTASRSPLELTIWSKETKKLKRALPWWLCCNNTTTKLNHFSFSSSACRLPTCYFSSLPNQVLTLLAENAQFGLIDFQSSRLRLD